MNPKVKKVLDKINDEGIESILPLFDNNFTTLLNYLKWGNAIEELKLDSSDLNNDFYKYLIKNGYEKKAIDEIIRSMASISYDGVDYFYEIRDLEDLSEFFSQRGGDASPQDVAKGVFSEDYWEPFSFYRSDINLMSEVYDDLTDENKKYLRKVIVDRYGKDLIGIPSEDVTDVIEKIGTEDENGDYEFYVTNENVMDLFSDDDTMNYLLKNYFDEIDSELFNMYSNAYNSAYTDEYYNKVWDELNGTFIDSDAKPIEFKYGNGYYTKLKITNVLPKLIKEYVSGDCYDIDSLGDYTYLIREGIGCGVFEYLSFKIYDYPDSWNVKKTLNEIFGDYI